jgi:hypothetical protein
MNAIAKVDRNKPKFRPILINGTSQNDEKISLYDNQLHSWTYHYLQIGQMTLMPQMVLIGEHFKKEEDIVFEQTSFRSSNLDEWFDPHHYKLTRIGLDEEININYKPEAPKPFHFGGLPIEIRSDHSQNVNKNKCEISEEIRIYLGGAEKQHINYWMHAIYMLSSFIDLEIGTTSHLPEIFGYYHQIPIEIDISSIPIRIEIITMTEEWRLNIRKPPSFFMIFTFRELEANFQILLNNWVEKYNKLLPAINILSGVRDNPNMYLDGLFINLTQAIESFHRRLYNGKYQSDEDYLDGLYKLLSAAIPSDIDPSFKMSLLNGKLKYANEYSLRKRLSMILCRMKTTYNIGFFSSKETINQFIDSVCDTRNYLTHYTLELEQKSAKGNKLYLLCQRLIIILEVLFFEEIGINSQTIRNKLEKFQRYVAFL